MQWITREHPVIDRIACPWLIRRFVDPDAEFRFVPPPEVLRVAHATGAIPFDVEGAELSHDGPYCSFDTILRQYGLTDPALAGLARIIRGADTDRLDLAPQSPGLLALSLGLARVIADDHALLRHGMVNYDALYCWARELQDERHRWNPARRPVAPS
ncbi:MAG TPA: chromate resistance protein ChrB domain-containing protein [Gemmatimonadales bacterium]|nr:chromate resistance protein ChrB domain-containing protein [Gemmatimonadales bacterium]